MLNKDIAYQADGVGYRGYLAVDETQRGRRPAILIGPEATGLSDVTRDVALRLAELGYVAFAFDFLGDGVVLPLEEARARVTPLMGNPESIRVIARAALQVLVGQDQADPGRVAAIGYCFGGQAALELARSGADLKAVVGFHSGLTTTRPQDAANIKGKVLVQIGSEDRVIPQAERNAFEAEMTAGGVDWRLIVYGGVGHSFTNREAARYGRSNVAFDPVAERRSWQAMIDLFDETFAPR